MGVNAALFAGAAVTVWIAGTKLARYADAIAEHTGIGREFLGILLLPCRATISSIMISTTSCRQ